MLKPVGLVDDEQTEADFYFALFSICCLLLRDALQMVLCCFEIGFCGLKMI